MRQTGERRARRTCLALRPLWRVSLPFGSIKVSSATTLVVWEDVFSTSASFWSGVAIGGSGRGDGGEKDAYGSRVL
jgi:hypothetical protein